MTGVPVFGNIAIGVVQGSRAKRQLDRVALLSQAPATVVRDGAEHQIAPAGVVLGDIVVANRGDEIQVDGRIVGSSRASLDKSALTGKSRAIDKTSGDTVQSGSAVVSGVARYEVEAVGADTFANRILTQAKGHRDVRTPLQSDIARAFVAVAVLIVVSGAVVVLALPAAGSDVTHDTVFAAAVLVTLVPQGLALMLTVTYAAAALRISRLGALAQRQSAIEAISRIDTFCSDKTGTLTTQRIAFGGVEPLTGRVVDLASVNAILAAVGSSTTAPNATTHAIARRIPEPPTDRRGSAVLIGAPLVGDPFRRDLRRPSGVRRTFVIGAPAVLAGAVPSGADKLLAQATELAAIGHRVLVLAAAPHHAPVAINGEAALPALLEPLVLLTFDEELRPEAQATVDGLRERGIDVKIVSGDDPTTVQAIGRRLGFDTDAAAASGLDLAAMNDEDLADVAVRTTIFGRVDPHLKARLVTALKSRGRYVAMTGDGVNDILPVRTADVGIAMQSGSPATRGVADLVLVRDDFSILPEAIRDGQRIVAAMTATLTVLLARTFYVLLIVVGASLLHCRSRSRHARTRFLRSSPSGCRSWFSRSGSGRVRHRSGILGQTLRNLGAAVARRRRCRAAGLRHGAPQRRVAGDRADHAHHDRVFLGTGALVLVPISADDRGRIRMPAWVRTTILVGAMTLAYLVVLSTGPGRTFFQLAPLPVGGSSRAWSSWPLPGRARSSGSTGRGSSSAPSTS